MLHQFWPSSFWIRNLLSFKLVFYKYVNSLAAIFFLCFQFSELWLGCVLSWTSMGSSNLRLVRFLKILFYVFHLSHLENFHLLFLWNSFSFTLFSSPFGTLIMWLLGLWLYSLWFLRLSSFFFLFFFCCYLFRCTHAFACSLSSGILSFVIFMLLLSSSSVLFFVFVFCQLYNCHLVLSYNFSFASIISIFHLFQKNLKLHVKAFLWWLL